MLTATQWKHLIHFESESEGRSVMSDSLQPHWTLQSVEFSKPEYWSGWPFPSPGDLPNPRIKIQVSRIAGGFFTPWITRDTGVGSLSLLQGIFPTQESNRGLLHCRQILCQLSYQGSPNPLYWTSKKKIPVDSEVFCYFSRLPPDDSSWW